MLHLTETSGGSSTTASTPSEATTENADVRSLKTLLESAFKAFSDDDNSSEEFTEKDLEEFGAELAKELPKYQLDKVINVYLQNSLRRWVLWNIWKE